MLSHVTMSQPYKSLSYEHARICTKITYFLGIYILLQRLYLVCFSFVTNMLQYNSTRWRHEPISIKATNERNSYLSGLQWWASVFCCILQNSSPLLPNETEGLPLPDDDDWSGRCNSGSIRCWRRIISHIFGVQKLHGPGFSSASQLATYKFPASTMLFAIFCCTSGCSLNSTHERSQCQVWSSAVK